MNSISTTQTMFCSNNKCASGMHFISNNDLDYNENDYLDTIIDIMRNPLNKKMCCDSQEEHIFKYCKRCFSEDNIYHFWIKDFSFYKDTFVMTKYEGETKVISFIPSIKICLSLDSFAPCKHVKFESFFNFFNKRLNLGMCNYPCYKKMHNHACSNNHTDGNEMNNKCKHGKVIGIEYCNKRCFYTRSNNVFCNYDNEIDLKKCFAITKSNNIKFLT